MEKSILQLSKESLTELSSLPHLKTEPKEKPKTKKKEGTAGRIGPATLPDKKKKPTIGDKTKERIKKHGGDLAKAAGGAAKEAGIEAVKDIAKGWVRKISGKLTPKN